MRAREKGRWAGRNRRKGIFRKTESSITIVLGVALGEGKGRESILAIGGPERFRGYGVRLAMDWGCVSPRELEEEEGARKKTRFRIVVPIEFGLVTGDLWLDLCEYLAETGWESETVASFRRLIY